MLQHGPSTCAPFFPFSEYPLVWGAVPPEKWGDFSREMYVKALQHTYHGTVDKMSARRFNFITTAFDHVVMHAPYNRLTWAAFQRFLYTDARRAAAAKLPLPANLEVLKPFVDLPLQSTYNDSLASTKALNAALDVRCVGSATNSCCACAYEAPPYAVTEQG